MFAQHEVMVQARRPVVTDYGTDMEPVGDPVRVRCGVRFLSTTQASDTGLVVNTNARLIAREWPGDAYSLVTFRGEEYEVLGEPLLFDGSEATRHWEVMLEKKRG